MHRLLFVVLALGTLAAVAHADIRPLVGKHSVGTIRGACSSAGGNFDVAADGGGYACHKKNCDGKGGTCSVVCDNNNNCVGSTPAGMPVSTSVTGVLSGAKVAVDPGAAAPAKQKPTGARTKGGVQKR
jgi:hypothetical protein